MIRAVIASLITGIVGGLAFALIIGHLFFDFLYLAMIAGFGYLTGETVSRAASYKRGRTLSCIAATGIVVALVIIAYFRFLHLFDLIGAGLAAYIAFRRLQ